MWLGLEKHLAIDLDVGVEMCPDCYDHSCLMDVEIKKFSSKDLTEKLNKVLEGEFVFTDPKVKRAKGHSDIPMMQYSITVERREPKSNNVYHEEMSFTYKYEGASVNISFWEFDFPFMYGTMADKHTKSKYQEIAAGTVCDYFNELGYL